MLQATVQGQGFGLTLPSTTTTSEAQSVVDALNAQNDRIFKVTIVSTVVVGIAAILNSIRLARQFKRDNAVMNLIANAKLSGKKR